MADLFDRFVGAAGALSSHTADSGDTWGPSGATITIDGSGSVYSPEVTAGADVAGISTWTPPGTDYAAAVVFGAGFRQSGIQAGLLLRASGTLGNYTCYAVKINEGSPDLLVVAYVDAVSNAILHGETLGPPQNLTSQIQAGDTLTATVSGTSPPVVTVYLNGAQIFQAPDTTVDGPIVTAGGAGVWLNSTLSGDTGTDVIRTVWAGSIVGSIGGPEVLTIAPTTPTVNLSATQSFALSTPFANESFAWTATFGSISGSAATETYTAPGSGSSDAVVGTSIDLPTRSVSAAVTLTPAPTPPPTAAPSRSGMSALRRAKLVRALKAEKLPKPGKVPPLVFTPPTPRVLRAAQPAPPERPAISDLRPGKAKLDFPIKGRS